MPPAGVALVIRAANDPRMSLADIARLIEREPGMTVNVLRLANSPVFSMGREVKSVSQAAVLLGARVIRNIAVAHAVTTLEDKIDTASFDRSLFWEDSLRRACAARVLARLTGYPDPSEAFTIGLLQDLGVLVMATQGHGDRLQALRMAPGAERRRSEIEILGKHHGELFVSLGRSWGLPRDIVEAVSLHHSEAPQSTDPRVKRLAFIARAADIVADITQTNATGDTLVRARASLDGLETTSPLALENVVDEVAKEMLAQGKDLQIHIREQPSFQTLVESANQALVRISYSYEELTRRLEELLRDKELLAKQLAESNAELRRLATTDFLTGVANRRAFMQALEARLREVKGSTRPTTLLMIDLDHFKRINDGFGHQGGDRVIAAVAKRLVEGVRLTDIVGRIGGEEFAILLTDCDEVDGQGVAERLRGMLSIRPVESKTGIYIPVTASLGGVTVRGPATADDVFMLADEALYEAKEVGRDCVRWSTFQAAE